MGPVKQCENIPNSNKRNVARTVCDTVVDSHEVEDCTETITEVCEQTNTYSHTSGKACGSLCAVSQMFLKSPKNKKELKTNKKAQEIKTGPHLQSDSYHQLLAAQNSSKIRCLVNVYLPS